MFSYRINTDNPAGPYVEILSSNNVFDVSGPWESLASAIQWADTYVQVKNSGIQEPSIN